MYSVSQRSQSVFQSRSVFQSNVKWDGGVLISQKSLIVDYANTTNVEFIVDLKVLFYGWLIYSYCTKVDQLTVRGVCRLVLWQHYTGLLIFRGKKAKFRGIFRGKFAEKSANFAGFSREKSQNLWKNRPISWDFRWRKVKIRRKIGPFRGSLAEKSQISKDFLGQILRTSADFTGNFGGETSPRNNQ